MSAEPVDYFGNHRLKMRFPWSLYHRPLVRAIARELAGAARERCSSLRVLNVGSGPFLERDDLSAPARFVLVDIDPRAIDAALAEPDPRIEAGVVLDPTAGLPFADASFDFAFASDVIEHVTAPAPWVREVLRVVRPGGRILLTTPNYAWWSTLPLIERTALEAVARAQGFTRRDIHPSRMTPGRLAAVVREAGGRVDRVRPTSLGWALVLLATRPGPP